VAYRTPTSEEMDEAAGYFLSEGFRINYPDAKMLCTIADLPQIKKALPQVTALEKLAGKTSFVNAVARVLQTPQQPVTTQDDLTSAVGNPPAEKGLDGGLEEIQTSSEKS
jgi:hypothetical protein